MSARYPLLQQISSNGTTNGTNTTADIAQAFEPEKVGPVGQTLHDVGIPYAEALGAAITFLVTVVALYFLGRATIVPFINRMLKAHGAEAHARRPLRRLVKVLVVFVAITIAFGVAGYGNFLSSLATIGAAATLAFGFAMQDTLANLVAGVFIYTDRPFRIGDWIEWPSSGGEPYQGIVEDITFRVTRVRTFDNELLTVPNATLTQNVIKNPVAKDQLRISVGFRIGYTDDINRASEIIRAEAHKHPEILDDPKPVVHLGPETALGDSSIGLTGRIWIADPGRADYFKIRGEYIANVKTRLQDAGIDIPFPRVDLSGEVGLGQTARFVDQSNTD